jgi:hypothetical protein
MCCSCRSPEPKVTRRAGPNYAAAKLATKIVVDRSGSGRAVSLVAVADALLSASADAGRPIVHVRTPAQRGLFFPRPPASAQEDGTYPSRGRRGFAVSRKCGGDPCSRRRRIRGYRLASALRIV